MATWNPIKFEALTPGSHRNSTEPPEAKNINIRVRVNLTGRKMDTISIVGGGPVGLRCASQLSEHGLAVSVFEEHATIGKPVQCAGLISKSGLEELGIKPGESAVNEVRGAKVFSPGGECLTVEMGETAAFVVDRFLFDQMLYRDAKKFGCEIRHETRLIDIRGSSLFLETGGHGEMRKSKIVIGADGANSTVRQSVFGKETEEKIRFIQGFQVRAEGKFEKHMVEVHFGSFAPGFFAWVIPESATVARIGIGARLGENVAECLDRFIREKGMEVRRLSKTSALIPIGAPAKEITRGNVLLAGDAAWQTKASTGGGVVFGLKAADVCARTITDSIKKQSALALYEKNLSPINRELSAHWRIYKYIHSLEPAQADTLFRKAKKAGVEKFLSQYGDMDKPSAFMGKMLLKPSMWGLLPAALKMV